MTLDQQLFELMLRAPACPEWFRPDMEGYENPTGEAETKEKYERMKKLSEAWNAGYKKERLIQWPSAYARMVMEAAKGNKGYSRYLTPEEVSVLQPMEQSR